MAAGFSIFASSAALLPVSFRGLGDIFRALNKAEGYPVNFLLQGER